MDNAIDHIAEEFEEIERINPWGRAVRWGGGIVILLGIIAWVVWLIASPPRATVSSSRMSYVPAGSTPIDLGEPRGSLSEPPTRFAWDSVTGRFQYIVKVYVKGTSQPVFERASTAPSFEMAPEERVRIPKGKSYVWTVVAQAKDGSTIGAGQASFKVR